MKNVLVTNTGDRSHARDLAQRPDLRVTFVTEARFLDQYEPGTDIIVVDTLNDPSTAAQSAVTQRGLADISHVVALSERAAPAAAYLRSILGLPGPSFESVLLCTNKHAMKRRFLAAGLTVAPFEMVPSAPALESAAARVGWPALVKPVVGAGVDATFVIDDRAALAAPATLERLARLTSPATTSEKRFPLLVEAFLPVVAEYHCDGYVVDGTVQHAWVSRYLRPVLGYTCGAFGSYLLDPGTPMARRVREMHDDATRAVSIRDGVTHFEALETRDTLYAGEIACRPGGGGIRRMLQLKSGFDIWQCHLATSLGEAVIQPSQDSEHQTDQLLQIMLPARRGTVQAISSPQDLQPLPEVLEVDLRLSVGDIVDGLMDSSTVSGYVFLRINHGQDPMDLVRAVENVFRLEVAAV
jgi:biotin carboxylase